MTINRLHVCYQCALCRKITFLGARCGACSSPDSQHLRQKVVQLLFLQRAAAHTDIKYQCALSGALAWDLTQ